MPAPSFHALRANRVVLRRLRDADIPAFVAYRSDPEVARYQSWSALSEPAARAFIEEMHDAEPGRRGEWFQFAIALATTDALIGDCALQVKSEDSQQAEIGYTLARSYHGMGLATEAITTLLDYVFLTLQLHRVVALVDCRNTPSSALLNRLGFRREGHMLQSFWLKGTWIDEYQYALLQAEWSALRGGKQTAQVTA